MSEGTKRFSGRRAIVTGGASGIGWAVTKRLVDEGARVRVWDKGPLPEDAPSAPVLAAQTVDLTDPSAVEDATAAAVKDIGGIDILVCSAGIAGENHLLCDYPVDHWRDVFDINVHGLFYCNRYVAPHMTAAGYGRIVNIASIAGKEGNPTASAYSASKAAVIGLTKSLGKELATTGVTVNSVTPAAVRTPIFEQVSEAHIQYMLSKIPMGRLGLVDEIAALVCWLASEECSFSTGAVFDVSGGRAVY